MNDRPLSRRQRALLSFIVRHIAEHGWAPTYKEMCRAVELSSTSTVAHQLNVLEARGYIARRDRAARAIRVLRDAS